MNKLIDIALVLLCTAAGCGIAALIVYAIPALVRKAVNRMNARDMGFWKEQTEMVVFEGEELKQELHEISLSLKRISGLLAEIYYHGKFATDDEQAFRRDVKAFLNALYGRIEHEQENDS